MRMRPQQAFPFAQRLPHQPKFGMLQIAQSAMDDAAGAAGRSRAKIALLHQQGASARTSTLQRDGNAVDAATNDRHIETVAVERRPHDLATATHLYLDAGSR